MRAHFEHFPHARDAGGVPVGDIRIEVRHTREEFVHIGDARDVPAGNGAVLLLGLRRFFVKGLDRLLQGVLARKGAFHRRWRGQRRRWRGQRREGDEGQFVFWHFLNFFSAALNFFSAWLNLASHFVHFLLTAASIPNAGSMLMVAAVIGCASCRVESRASVRCRARCMRAGRVGAPGEL